MHNTLSVLTLTQYDNQKFQSNIYWFWYTVLWYKHKTWHRCIYTYVLSQCIRMQFPIAYCIVLYWKCFVDLFTWWIFIPICIYTPQNIQYKLHAQYYASLFIYLLLIMVRHSSGVHSLFKSHCLFMRTTVQNR